MRLTISTLLLATCAMTNATALVPRAGAFCVSVTAPEIGTVQPIACSTGTCEVFDIGTFSFDKIGLTFSVGLGVSGLRQS